MKTKIFPWQPRFFSLRAILIVPYVSLVVGLAALIAYLSYTAGERAVLTISAKFLTETVGRISLAIDQQLLGSDAVLEAAFPNGVFVSSDLNDDVAGLRNRFWVATSIHTNPNNYVYFANPAGQNFGLIRHTQSEGELRFKMKPESNRSLFFFTGANGESTYLRDEDKFYDPRTRPWYQVGMKTKENTWTPPYIDFRTNELIVTRVRQVLSKDGEIAGVVATDVSLHSIGEFLRGIETSDSGLAFIMETSGELIGTSLDESLVQMQGDQKTRLNAKDVKSPLLRSVVRRMQNTDWKVATQAKAQSFNFVDETGERIHIAYDRVRNNAGLEWIIVVAVPSSDFMGEVNSNVKRTAFIGLIAVIIGVALGFKILNWVALDLKQLTDASLKLGSGLADATLNIQRNDEIGLLADNFRKLQTRLQTDKLTGLCNRDIFEKRLNAKIAMAGEDPEGYPFAILFIDLNGFKAINDQFGHAAGDLALIEVAHRLRACVRADDVIARYAGDEFVVLLDQLPNRDSLERVRTKFSLALGLPLNLQAADGLVAIKMGGAIGVAHFPTDAKDAKTLLETADHDMYSHKLSAKSNASHIASQDTDRA